MRFRPPRPFAVDTLIALAMVCVAVLLGQESAKQGWPALDGPAYALVVLAHLPVAFRGRAPLVVFGTVEAVTFGYVTLGYWPVVCTFGPMLALYTVASVRQARTTALCAGLLVIEAFARQAGAAPDAAPPPDLAALTSRELEVLKLVAGGLSNLEIADRLYISEATVKTHLNRTMTKLGLDSRAQAVVVAYETGLVTPRG
ncbi:helix-turn-helix domain-containing protein [Streptomyces siamensis]|uniref:HTH luxR-type domain-containing protein n=1 Tax=Streptomyces siamensis TaxID=1274986 RepID=A0ABP9JFB1_9ACTN